MAVRDPNGFRPLVLGRIKDAVVVASETCALDLIDATYEREIEPGEVVRISAAGVESFHPFPPAPHTRCVFEYIYFARPDSRVFDRNVYEVRKQLGRQLAREQPVEADIVIPVPDSGVPAALGFAEHAGLPFEMGLIRNHYVGRTFIEPQDAIRHFGVKMKLNAQADVLRGKRVVVVDDSIVRGTTSRKIVNMVRNAGAREVHVRISSPPTISSCFYGVDTPTKRRADRVVELGRGHPRVHHRRLPRLPERARPVQLPGARRRATASAPPASPAATRSRPPTRAALTSCYSSKPASASSVGYFALSGVSPRK